MSYRTDVEEEQRPQMIFCGMAVAAVPVGLVMEIMRAPVERHLKLQRELCA